MSAFENLEIAYFTQPTTREVLGNLRRDRPCRANPSSRRCVLAGARDRYLLRDQPVSAICRDCPVFEAMRQDLIEAWEEWVLAMQEVYA